ncbi:MAG: hypothetical protein IH631_09095 [Candidatus Thorarchaeota archaeon]|nr:hypothetical protein [Candidatus Thorarchaeota archaeon]
MPERQRLLSLIQETVAEDAPYIWVYQSTEFRTWGTWVHGDGLVYNPMHQLYFYHMYKTDSPDQPLPGADTTPPQTSHPADIEMIVGTTGMSVTWTATDLHRDVYEIKKDGLILESGDWNTSSISMSLDGLQLGSYNFTITVQDTANNTVSDTVDVTVVQAGFEITQIMVIIISIGSIGVIVVVIVLLVKSKG